MEWPADSTNRSRPVQDGSVGSCRNTRWNSVYASGARLIAVPGWPLPTRCMASAASTRMVSTARVSTSVQSSGTRGVVSWVRSSMTDTLVLLTVLVRRREADVLRLDLSSIPTLARWTGCDLPQQSGPEGERAYLAVTIVSTGVPAEGVSTPASPDSAVGRSKRERSVPEFGNAVIN